MGWPSPRRHFMGDLCGRPFRSVRTPGTRPFRRRCSNRRRTPRRRRLRVGRAGRRNLSSRRVAVATNLTRADGSNRRSARLHGHARLAGRKDDPSTSRRQPESTHRYRVVGGRTPSNHGFRVERGHRSSNDRFQAQGAVARAGGVSLPDRGMHESLPRIAGWMGRPRSLAPTPSRLAPGRCRRKRTERTLQGRVSRLVIHWVKRTYSSASGW